MNTRKKFHLFNSIAVTVLLWLTVMVNAFSQEYIFDVEVINIEDGLPHRNTYGIVQDKQGFIWLSTLAGISRYDGYNFKTYDRSLLNIPENYSASHVAVDAANRIWYSGVKSKNDLYSFSGLIDSHQDSIYTMDAFSGGRFTSSDVIYIGNSKTTEDDVIIATRSGIIYRYDGDFKEIYKAPLPFPGNVFCEALPDGSYWLIYRSNLRDNEVFRIKKGKIVQHFKVDHWIKRIVTSYPELILETPYAPAATHWKLEKDSLVPFRLKGHAPKDIIALLQFHKDYTCYATESELLIQDKQGNIIYRFDQFKFLDRKFTGCQNTLSDRQHILWATTGNGIIKLSARKNPFKNFGITNSIRGIYRDGTQLWAGKVVTDVERGLQKELPVGPRATISTFYNDQQGNLWIGTTSRKMIQYIPAEDRYVHYKFEAATSFHLVFRNVITKNYWVGTNNGLFRFDPGTQKITPFNLSTALEKVYVRQCYQNTRGIWIATDKGVFLMDAEKEVILKHYTTANGLPFHNINHIYEDKDGIFWLGAKGGGLLRWDLRNNTFRQYTRKNGLSNDNIYAVYEDDFETLWLPSDYGLMAFDKNAETARVYLPEHGISHEEFNTFSHFQDTDGTLYFGGLKGLTSFHPRDLQQQTATSPPLYATQVNVLEKDVTTFTDRTNTFKAAKKIVLDPNDRILEVELTLLDYERSGENQYAYKLSGKQEQWIYTRENKLSIINPPYGKYDLTVKARGASGTWSAAPLVIPMHVKTPFYMQWWFILALALVTITAIVIAVRWRIQKLEKDRTRLENEVRKRTRQIEEDKKIIEKDKQVIEKQAEALKVLDRAKTRFFANITHEFRTPLTLVAGPVEQMIAEKPPPRFKERLNNVLKNTRNLMHLINQLLDLSKLEGSRMKVEISHGDSIRYTRELVSRFQPLADKKQLQLEFKADTEVWKIHMDIDKWTKIVHNLLSNAIKFTPEGGKVTVLLEQVIQDGQHCLQLLVKDTGIGITAESLEHIFNRFYQADASSTRLQGGTGIGLSLVKELVELQDGTVSAESVVGKGTEFTVLLPLAAAPETGSMAPMPVPEMVSLPLETAPENEQSVAKSIADSTKIHSEKLELLIIEDNAEMRSYIRSCIDASVYTISEAANGEEGIEKAQEMVPDLIISDVMMPKKNGFEVTQAIRTHIATSHIPLILLTAKASLESRLEGLKRGADAYLTKPFSPQELMLRIKKLIELRKLLQQRYHPDSYRDQQPPDGNTEFEKEDGFVDEFKNYILDNISEPDLHVGTISQHFSISRMQLYRKLKALINKPIADYVRSIRLEKAMELLKEQKLNVSEAAYATGFSSPNRFSKAFKKAYGKAPSKLY